MVETAPVESGLGAELRRLIFCARSPQAGFHELVVESPTLSSALWRMLFWRTPFALAELVLGWLGFARLYQSLGDPASSFWQNLASQLPREISLEDVHALLRELPPLPGFGRVLAWLLLLSPFVVISLWLHDAVWDHTCLWMLRGLKTRKSFRISMIADAEALTVGTLGAAVALLVNLPAIGWLLMVPVGMVGTYFWILRGFALAAFHGCPLWKGVVATLLHVVLMVLFVLGSLLLLGILLFLQVG